MITLKEKKEHGITFYDVLFNENKLIGEFISLEDGYFYFLPNKDNTGFWTSYELSLISEKLNEVNMPWDKHINNYFNQKEK